MLLGIKYAFCARIITLLLITLGLSACAVLKELDVSKYRFSESEEISVEDTPEYQLVNAVLLEAIIPWHNNLERDLTTLNEKSERFCLQPSAIDFARLQNAWINAMHSWSTIGVFNFGPIDDANSAWKFQFWPDPLNYVHRKFKSRLSGSNTAISEEELAAASVAIQGLSAIEYLIFDPENGRLTSYDAASIKCKILMGTTSNLAKEGYLLTKAWNTDYKQAWLNPVIKNSPQTAARHYLETILNGMLTNLSLLKDRKLGTPLGIKQTEKNKVVKEGKLKVKRLESWRSETSLLHIKSNLMAMEKLYLMPKGYSWYLLQDASNEILDQKIKALFANIFELIYLMKDTAEQQIQSKQTQSLEALYKEVDMLFTFLRYDYMTALNLHYRFNSHDGD